MIGRLHGVVAEIEAEEALIDVGGVGYLVRMGARSLSRLPPLGEPVTIQVESQTREDGTRLYGFLDRDERRAFTALQSVQGVGPKAALAVLDVLPPSELAAAVAREDKASVARAQGVGPRLAQRIVTELKDKPIAAAPALSGFAPAATVAPAPGGEPSLAGEATAALMGLGYAEPVSRRAVEQALAAVAGADLPAVIKRALQELAR